MTPMFEVPAAALRTAPQWSNQQQAIFGWFETGTLTASIGDTLYAKGAPARRTQNLVVRARAGTGKTTTIIEGVNRAPDGSILLCAFNKRIADELSTRLTSSRASARTLHSVGFSAVRKFWNGVSLAPRTQDRADTITAHVCPNTVPDDIKKLVTRIHTMGREVHAHAAEPGDLLDMIYTYDMEADEEWRDEFPAEKLEAMALAAMDFAASAKPAGGIDFTDMVFLPVRNGWLRPAFDMVVVDEAQDMNATQLEIAQKVCRPQGRICVVGDDRQAIYGFRGADSSSLDRLKRELKAGELGLTITYRCAQSIVKLAQALVPDFQAGPSNPQGTVERLGMDKMVEQAQAGDFILSRLNAPIVGVAMSLLRNNKPARVAGRDIGAGLKALVRKLATGKAKDSVPEFLGKVMQWEARELARAMKMGHPEKVEPIHDKAEVLRVMADGAVGMGEVLDRCDTLFSDDKSKSAVICSSIHRSKGLESPTVYLLADTIRREASRPIEEANIEYVAITRAKNRLVLVGGAGATR